MKLTVCMFLLLFSLGCQQEQSKSPTTVKHFDTEISQILNAGYFEEYLFESGYLHGIGLDFDLSSVLDDDGNPSRPSVSLLLKNLDRSQYINFEYYQVAEPYLAIQVVSGEEYWFEEYPKLDGPISQLEMRFDDENVYLKADTFTHAMGIPFEPSLLAIQHASAKITNRIDFYYK